MSHRLSVRLAAATLIVLSLTGFRSATSLFAPDAELWPRWQQHDANSTASIDFSEWTALLQARVSQRSDGVGLFDYGAMTAADHQTLDAFIARMAALEISSYSRPQQMAYWINLYNALTVDVVLEHYPVPSIREIDISPGFFADGPWGKKLVTVEGEQLTLNEIEHRVLRPIWQDARVHYAVNCASIGCPNLASEAYRGDAIDAQLDAAARAYINNWRGVTVKGGEIDVSSIYDWFYDDFGGSDDSLMAHLIEYAEPELAGQLRQIGAISGTMYDWNLNDAGKR